MGILDSIGAYLGDEENRLNLASGFNNMSGNPNAGNIQSGINQRLKGLGDKRALEAKTMAAAQTNTDSLAALKDAGIDDKLLAIAKVNPELMKSITKTYAEAKLRPDKQFAFTFSTPRVDESTGTMFVIKSNPSAGTSERIDIPNTTSLTAQQKADMQIATSKEEGADTSAQRLNEADVERASVAGIKAYEAMRSIDNGIIELDKARRLVVVEGASAGILQKFLPSFDAATSEFRAIANRLGIQVINSATFGALSKTELKLALTTGFPTDLSGVELVKWIDDKIDAQKKMSRALRAKARELTTGESYSTFIQRHTTDAINEKGDINPAFNTSGISALDAAIAKKKAKL